VLDLTIVTAPLTGLLSILLAYLPRLAGAADLLLVAWGLATLLRTIVTRVTTPIQPAGRPF
jgi:hypothetical protein